MEMGFVQKNKNQLINHLEKGSGKPWQQQFQLNYHQNNSAHYVADNSPLPIKVLNPSVAVTDNRLYLLGGLFGKSVTSAVFTAEIDKNSKFVNWTTSVSLPKPLYDTEILLTRGHLFVIGGRDDYRESSDIYASKLDEDGKITTWEKVGELPEALHGVSAFVTKNVLYVFGGHDFANDAAVYYYCSLSPEGELGEWEKSFIQIEFDNVSVTLRNKGYMDVAVTHNQVYLIAGEEQGKGTFCMYRGTVNEDGIIDLWEREESLKYTIHRPKVLVTNNRLFIFGLAELSIVPEERQQADIMVTCIIYEDGTLGQYHYETVSDVGCWTGIKVFVVRNNFFIFGFNGLQFNDEDCILYQARFKSDYSSYTHLG